MTLPGIANVTAAIAFGLAVASGGLAVSTTESLAQKAEKSATPKAGKDEKVCRYKFPSGERRVWICKKVEPCCAWDAIKYVKCGSTITGCL